MRKKRGFDYMRYKCGDKVKTEFGNGIIREVQGKITPYLVEHYDWHHGHNGNESASGSYQGSKCWWFEEDELNLLTSFTKDDFQDGDIITDRDGDRAVFFEGYFYGGTAFDLLSEVTDDFRYWDFDRDNDIIKIERPNIGIMYERHEVEVREMTVEEISKELGYEVKVVK